MWCIMNRDDMKRLEVSVDNMTIAEEVWIRAYCSAITNGFCRSSRYIIANEAFADFAHMIDREEGKQND